MGRRIVWGMILCALITSLSAGCSGNRIIDRRNQVENLHENDRVEIVFWHTYSEEETRVFETEVLPRFHEQHPDIIVKPERVYHTNELKHTLIGRATSNNPPDVVRLDIAWVPQFASLGVILPVDSFADFQAVRKKLNSSALETGYLNGRYYSLPLNMNTKAAIYNRQMLLEAGLARPPQSMEEVIEIAREHGWTIGMSNVHPWSSLPYLYSLGGRLTNDDYTHSSGYLDSEATVAALTTLHELYVEGVLNPELFSTDFDGWNGVIRGDVFMIEEGPWFYSILGNDPAAKIDVFATTVVAPFPSAHGPASILGGENLVIMKSARNLDAVWTFMMWMTDKEAQLMMFKTGMIPTNEEAASHVFTGEHEQYINVYVESMQSVFLRPPIADLDAVEELFVKMMNNIFIHQRPVADEAAAIARQIDRILADAKGKT